MDGTFTAVPNNGSMNLLQQIASIYKSATIIKPISLSYFPRFCHVYSVLKGANLKGRYLQLLNRHSNTTANNQSAQKHIGVMLGWTGLDGVSCKLK
eukprot:1349603-Ditylum_brightwellii.AAC.1